MMIDPCSQAKRTIEIPGSFTRLSFGRQKGHKPPGFYFSQRPRKGDQGCGAVAFRKNLCRGEIYPRSLSLWWRKASFLHRQAVSVLTAEHKNDFWKYTAVSMFRLKSVPDSGWKVYHQLQFTTRPFVSQQKGTTCCNWKQIIRSFCIFTGRDSLFARSPLG